MNHTVAMTLVSLFLCAAGAGISEAFSGPKLAPGMPMPALRGELLTGEKAELPAAAAGKTALIALGFTYDSRLAVDAWTKAFRDRLARDPSGVTFFEVPMIGGLARMARPFIDSGMRKGTPAELHRNVMTVYGGTGDWKKMLDYREKDAAYLILIDGRGIIRWLHAGKFDAEKFEELAAACRNAAGR